MNDQDDLVDALGPVVAAFGKLKILHYVGGSIASSFHGATRSTMDVDVVCDMRSTQVSPFLGEIDSRFYVSETAVRKAVERTSCFNLIHLSSSFKVDVFVSRHREFDQDCMRRARVVRLGNSKTIEVPIASVEDSIISKLEWYRLTDETSERQWEDVTRLLRLMGQSADMTYLKSAAESVGVVDLLTRLTSQLQ